MTYELLQEYWWFLVSLLGALLAFLLFVQGANAVMFSLGKNDMERKLIINSTGRKWEITFTTLVTFGGAFFASFPLFYSTSFGGAYWLWMIILFTFVMQAVSYEFQNKKGNLLGTKAFQWFLIINGLVGPLLIGGAIGTFFNGSNFVVAKDNFIGMGNPVISHWANASHGLDALLDPWNVIFGLAVMFLAQVNGILYIMNNVENENIRCRCSVRLVGCLVAFLVFFIATVVHILLKDGFAYNPFTGIVYMEPYKYLNNFIEIWPLLLMFLLGVGIFLYGSVRTIISKTFNDGIWFTGAGTVFVVLSLLINVGLNYTAFYPSLADLQSSLTISNSCSSEFTLTVMAIVSILVPFVLAYIINVWRQMDRFGLGEHDLKNEDTY